MKEKAKLHQAEDNVEMGKRQLLKNCISIGVDVSKAKLDITEYNGVDERQSTIKNDPGEIRHWLSIVKEYRGIIICESTGWYHYLFAHMCFVAGLDIRVLNPLLASKHSKSSIRKVKKDSVDSRQLAIMGVTEPDLPARPNLSLDRIKFRKRQGLLHSLEKRLQSMKLCLVNYKECGDQLGIELSDAELLSLDIVKQLEKIKNQVAAELDALAQEIAEQEEMDHEAILRSVPGYRRIAPLLSVMLDPHAASEKAWIGFTGLDISVRESGTWKGRTRLTKRGNPYLRKRLYQATWGACLNDPVVRAYYDQLKQDGRKHTEAVIILARKLLRIAYALVQKRESYDATIAFAS